MNGSLKTILLTALSALALATPAAADTLKPTRFDDPKPGVCKPHDCSLREAILEANATDERDTINLSAGKYEIERDGQLDPEAGSLDIGTPMVVRGAGAKATSIDGAALDRVMDISVPQDEIVTIKGLTLRNGFAPAAQSIGGGILNVGAGDLNLRAVAVRRSFAQRGGGIAHMRARLDVTRSTIAGNRAGEGGGIATFAGENAPRVNLNASTVSRNEATKGAGVLADGHPSFGPDWPDVQAYNSTFAANEAKWHGGGLMADNGAVVRMFSSTVAHNAADVDGVDGGDGGGLFEHGGSVINLGDSVVGENRVGGAAQGHQCAGAVHSLGGVVIQQQGPGACDISGPAIQPADPMLGSLAGNGGPTQTVELLRGSPALGFGLTCAPQDQRGEPRPANGCDSGAFERPFAGKR